MQPESRSALRASRQAASTDRDRLALREGALRILGEIFRAMLAREVRPAPRSLAARAEDLTAGIEVSGAWEGGVSLRCPPETAADLAVWFAGLEAPVDPEDVVDALGELVNVAAGNLKSLLPGPSALAIPVVRRGASPLDLERARALCRIDLEVDERLIELTLWEPPLTSGVCNSNQVGQSA